MSDASIHAISGGLAGIISMTLTYPLVVLSTRSAVSRKSTSTSKPLNTIEALQKVLHEEGVEGLYAGLSSSLVGIAVTNTIFYFGLEEVRSTLSALRIAREISAGGKVSKGSPIWETMLASTIAGAATTVATNPLWLVQTWLATRGSRADDSKAVVEKGSSDLEKGESSSSSLKAPAKTPNPTILQAIQAIYARSGLTGFWAGLGPALILVINPVLQYTAFEVLGRVLRGFRRGRAQGGVAADGGKLGDGEMFVLGAVSKLVATSVTYPYIVVKSRLQASTHHYKSSIQAVLSILKEEGVAGLYGGLSQKIVQSVLTAAFLFVAQRRVFELVKTLIQLTLVRRSRVAAAGILPK